MQTRKLAGIVFGAFLASALIGAQTSGPAGQTAKKAATGEKCCCEGMMAGHEESKAKMEAMEGRLEEMVQRMNSAAAAEKVDATVAVLNELVTLHKQMKAHGTMPAGAAMGCCAEMGAHRKTSDAKHHCPMMSAAGEPRTGHHSR